MKTKILIIVIILANLLAIGCAIFCNKETPLAKNIESLPEIKIQGSLGWAGDGLRSPETVVKNRLSDMESGIAGAEEFLQDINGDGKADKITRTRVETGTAHGYDLYKIELSTSSGFVDITPQGFRTVEGADCMLKELQFRFRPEFSVIVISRPWKDSWITPTMATRSEYKMVGNEMKIVSTQNLSEVCDVTELF